MRPALLIAAIGLVIANGNHAIAGARRSRSLSVARCISLRLAAFLPSKIGCTGIFLASVQFKSFQAHPLLIWHSRCDDFSKGSRIPKTRSFLGKAAAAQCLLSRPASPKADRPQSTRTRCSGRALGKVKPRRTRRCLIRRGGLALPQLAENVQKCLGASLVSVIAERT
jgi:hypothetical protein